MPIKPEERTSLRDNNQRTLLMRKIDQKILDAGPDEIVMFQFWPDTPRDLIFAITKEYQELGWYAECGPLTAEPGEQECWGLSLSEVNNVAPTSDAEQQLKDYARLIVRHGAVNVRWNLSCDESRRETKFRVEMEAIFCTLGGMSEEVSHTSEVTVRSSSESRWPHLAAAECVRGMESSVKDMSLVTAE